MNDGKVKTMGQKLECYQQAPAMTPDGKRLVALSFGVSVDPAKHHAPNGMPILWDTRAQIFVPEEEWKSLKKRFEVGREYRMDFEGESITLKKA